MAEHAPYPPPPPTDVPPSENAVDETRRKLTGAGLATGGILLTLASQTATPPCFRPRRAEARAPCARR